MAKGLTGCYIPEDYEGQHAVPSNFNGLNNGQVERLSILIEELAEAQHVACKILRHGFQSHHPDEHLVPNRALLQEELADVQQAVSMLVDAGDLYKDRIDWLTSVRNLSPKRNTHHQQNQPLQKVRKLDD